MRPLPASRVPWLLCLSSFFLLAALVAHADTAEEIQAKIQAQSDKIAALEKEISKYEQELLTLGASKNTLQSEVTRLDTSRKKISADISVTSSKISKAELTISELSDQIVDKEGRISVGRDGIRSSLKSMQSIDNTTLVEMYLGSNDVAEAWEDIDRIVSLQTTIRDEIDELFAVKVELTDNRDVASAEKSKLAAFQRDLTNQKVILDQNRAQQAALLTATKNKESEYQKILEQKRAAKLQFERELTEFESALKYTLDPSSIPPAGRGVLSFPLDQSYMLRCPDKQSVFKNHYCVTQFFGNTAFAQSGAYNGAGHNGIDFGAPEGVKIVAARSGTVLATGNTDAYKGCYSYGKWVLVKHNDGLSTLYAHLSLVSVREGDEVPTGALLGYVGKTGYATGPHLHFTVYASDGVRIVRMGDIKAKTNCANALVPIAPTNAYLDPMQYL